MAIYFNNGNNPDSITFEWFDDSGEDAEWPDRVLARRKRSDGSMNEYRIVWQSPDSEDYENLETIKMHYGNADRVISLKNMRYSYTGIEQGTNDLIYVYRGEITAYSYIYYEKDRQLGVMLDVNRPIQWSPSYPSYTAVATIISGIPSGLSFYRAFYKFTMIDYAIRTSLDGESTYKYLTTNFELTNKNGILITTEFTNDELGKILYTNISGIAVAGLPCTIWLKLIIN